MRRRILALVLLLSCALPSLAQPDMNDPRVRRLMELNAVPPESRTSAQLDETVLLLFELLMEELVKAVPEPERSRLVGLRPVLRRGEGTSPVVVRGKEIRISEDYPGPLIALGALLAHDLRVTRFGFLETPNPILDQPVSVSALLPLMTPLRLHLDSPFFLERLALLQCARSDADCRDLAMPSIASILSFVLSHEIAHVLLGHAEKLDRSLEEEMAADSTAWPFAQRLAADFLTGDTSFDEAARLAFFAGPLVTLQYELYDEQGKEEAPEIARRRDALLARVPESLREEVAELLFPQRSDENVGKLDLSWEAPPQRLWIDGVEIPPAEVGGRELVTAAGAHHVFAWSPEGMAYERILTGGRRRAIRLRFRPVAEAPAPPEELRKLHSERRWFDLLLQTSDAALQPREKSLLMLHAEALRSLHLSDLIAVPADGLPSAEEARRLGRWKRAGAPLLFWQ